jgi:MoaA/NifB/PqqE/SkfB family radical SAM enzyme
MRTHAARTYVLSKFLETRPSATGELELRHVLREDGVPLPPSAIQAMRAKASLDEVAEALVDSMGLEPLVEKGLLIAEGSARDDYRRTVSLLAQALAESSAAAPPLVTHIEVTSVCQARCVMCPKGCGRMTRRAQHMPLRLFHTLVDQLPGLPSSAGQFINLHAFGEPLLNPHIVEMVSRLVGEGFRPALGTNAGFEDLERVEACLAAGLAELWVSVDATDEATYQALRGSHLSLAAVQRFARKVRALIERRGYSTRLVVQLIEMESNRRQIVRFLERWALSSVHAHVQPFQGMPDIEPAFDESLRYPARPLVCTFPWTKWFTILSSGAVVTCCIDYDGETEIGNVRRRPLASIVGSARLRTMQDRALRAMLRRDPGHVCGRCRNRWYDPNRVNPAEEVGG